MFFYVLIMEEHITTRVSLDQVTVIYCRTRAGKCLDLPILYMLSTQQIKNESIKLLTVILLKL